MKYINIMTFVAAAFTLFSGATAMRGQNAVRLQQQVVIPARHSSSIGEVNAATEASPALSAPVQLEAQMQPQPPPAPAPAFPEPARLSLEDGLPSLSLENGDGVDAAKAPGALPREPRTLQNIEMIARMRAAVEQIAAEYGNPTFVQLFTNDSVQAQVWRKRLHLIQSADLIAAELASLERKKKVANEEVEATRLRLAALHAEAEQLAVRLQQVRPAISMAK